MLSSFNHKNIIIIMITKKKEIVVYTDGSCHHIYKTGGWAAILLYDDIEILLQGVEQNTTHNRMELLAVIKSLHYICSNDLIENTTKIVSDSQYVVNIIHRMEKFEKNLFLSAKGTAIRNKDLVEKLIYHIKIINPKFTKIKAHQKKSKEINYNRHVDKISRKIVRDYIKEHQTEGNE